MSSIFTANRIAAIAAFLTGVSAIIVGATKSLPQKWADGATVIVGVIGSVVTVLHFMSGSQKYDQLIAYSSNSGETDSADDEPDEVTLDGSEGTPAAGIVAAGAPTPEPTVTDVTTPAL